MYLKLKYIIIPGPVYALQTDNIKNYRHHQLYIHNKRMRFWVRACKDASISLQSTNADDWGRNSYEIILGESENTRTVIKKMFSTQILTEVETWNILSCDDLRHFWISWEHDMLEMGSGDMYDRSFMVWPLPINTDMQVVSVATSDVYGEWELEQLPGTVIYNI